jgi:hypothetical protein
MAHRGLKTLMLIAEDWHFLSKDLSSTKFVLQITVALGDILVSALLVLSETEKRTAVSTACI